MFVVPSNLMKNNEVDWQTGLVIATWPLWIIIIGER